jgi:HPr kinase/phosphorylase
MDDKPTIGHLLSEVGQHMALSWLAGRQGANKALSNLMGMSREHHLIGPLNFIHPNRLQLIGKTEMAYLNGLGHQARWEALQQLYNNQPVAVLLTEGVRAPTDLIEAADEHEVPLLASESPDHQALEQLQYYVSHFLAERSGVHGVFIEVLGMGVLITGEAGIGKSEVALELISRGHRLIADDAPEFARTTPDRLVGYCPPMLQDFLEVRGLGILNIRALFGESAIKTEKNLKLIVNLQPADSTLAAQTDRLMGDLSQRRMLGLKITQVNLSVGPGRNTAILIETAVRMHMLRIQGYDAGQDFIERQGATLRPT